MFIISRVLTCGGADRVRANRVNRHSLGVLDMYVGNRINVSPPASSQVAHAIESGTGSRLAYLLTFYVTPEWLKKKLSEIHAWFIRENTAFFNKLCFS